MTEWEIFRIKTKVLDKNTNISVIDTIAETFDCDNNDIEYLGEEED